MREPKSIQRCFGNLLLIAIVCSGSASVAQVAEPLPLILRYDSGGIDNITKAMQWSPDGKILYAAGWNKIVQIYRLDEATRQFQYLPQQNFRIPIESGRFGIIEAMVVSPSGRSLVVAGSGWDGTTTPSTGYVWPRSSAQEQDWKQIGAIYVFDTVTRVCRVLRGHKGAVRRLAFVDNGREPTQLVSLGFEYEGQKISQSVRLWALESGTQIGQTLPLAHVLIPPSTDISPRIQAWESAPGVTNVAVAAWRIDGVTPVSELMIWKPMENGLPQKLTGAPLSMAFQTTGQGVSRQLFCGGLGAAKMLAVGDGQPMSLQPVVGLSGTATPFAATTIPATSGAATAHIAVVSVQLQPSGDREYQLSIQDGNAFRPVGTLWINRTTSSNPTPTLIEPVVSASPDGHYLSIAGSMGNEIRVYRSSDLLRIRQPLAEIPPLQILTGKLLSPYSVVFVRNEKTLGIAVGPANGPSLSSLSDGTAMPTQSVVVDAGARTAASETSDWLVDRSETGPWKTRIAGDSHGVEVSDGSSSGRVLRVPSDYRAEGIQEEVTAHAGCVEHGTNPPLAAVATHIQGEPFLHLYNSRTGVCLRMLRGHERRITDLAFSSDGRLLLSSALDGTVRGWLLDDLSAATVNQVGWLRGLLIESVNGQIVVDRMEADCPANQAGIRQGDVISGFVTEDQFDAIRSSAEFYLRISQTAPERHAKVTLRLLRANQPLDIDVPLEQGMDLREPLFSLLVSSFEDGQGSPQWLTWSPLGQFDFRGSELERQLGWHINTKDDTTPVRFASIEQYRDRFRQQGLLRQLLGGNEVSVRKAVSPSIHLSLITVSGEVLSPNYDDELILREPDGELIMELDDQSGDLVSTVDWSIGEQPPQKFALVERDVWKSPVSAAVIGRNEHRLLVRMITNDVPPAEYTRAVTFRYQPAAPRIKLNSPAQALSAVRSERLLVQAAVEVAVKADVHVVHEFPDGTHNEFLSEMDVSGNLTRELNLKAGRNVIRLQVTNKAIPESLQEHAAEESASLEIVVEYAPAGPPKIVIHEVHQTDPDSNFSQPTVIADGKLRTDVPEITIRGSMEGTEPLQEATLWFEETTTTLNQFRANAGRVAEFSQTIRLKPGEQLVVFSGSAGGESGRLPIDIVYQPRLPDVTLVTPTDREVVIDAGRFDGTFRVESRLHDTRKFPFTYEMLINDRPVDASALSFDADRGMLIGSLPLRSDSARPYDIHRIELRLRNEWGSSSRLPLTVRFKHPPRLKTADVKRKAGTALADIVSRVEISPARLVTGMGVRVNDVEMQAVTFSSGDVADGHQNITLPGVALVEGANRIEVYAVNADGDSNTLIINEVVPPASKKAEIRLIRPLTSRTSSQPALPISFVVMSEPGLERVDLVVERDYRAPQRIGLMADNPLPPAEGDQTVIQQKFEHTMLLTDGANRVRIEVQNRGGITAQSFAITYMPPPVSIVVERLVTDNETSPVYTTEDFQDNPAFVSSVDRGVTTLVGKIEWIPGHRPRGTSWTVRVWVNGFLKTLKVTAPAESIQQVDFRVPLVLNLPKNRVRIEAPEITTSHQKLAMDDHSISALQNILVSCNEPEQRQRLHLILMGVVMENGRNLCRAEDLTESAAAALRLHTPETAFASIKSYSPLVGERAIGRNLKTVMVMVETQIAQQRLASGVNDVVMFYYRGREYRATDGNFLLEDFQNYDNPVAHPQSISENYLAGLFEHLPGAHVVFLDIENAQNEEPAAVQWPRFPNLGVFRVAWSGRKPLPEPPGPLFSTLEVATDVASTGESASLGDFQKRLHTELQPAGSDHRFILETFVPEDMLQLVLARLPAAP